MQRLFNWLTGKASPAKKPAVKTLRQTTAPKVKPRPAKPTPTQAQDLEFSGELGGKIADGGPGKNVLVRNKYVREDTGTHETLTIIDDSIAGPEDEDGMDPYNSGRFDRAKSWDSSRSRK